MTRRYVVYGAGAVGGVIGARLHLAGHDVTLVARGEHLARIRSDGLVLDTISVSRAFDRDDGNFGHGEDAVGEDEQEDDEEFGSDATLYASPGCGQVRTGADRCGQVPACAALY